MLVVMVVVVVVVLFCVGTGVVMISPGCLDVWLTSLVVSAIDVSTILVEGQVSWKL